MTTLLGQVHIVQAAELSPQELISRAADKYGIIEDHLYKTLDCESQHFIEPAIHNPSKKENSWGWGQFNLPTDLKTSDGRAITKEIAIDPIQAVDAVAYNFSIGKATRWTCFTMGVRNGWK